MSRTLNIINLLLGIAIIAIAASMTSGQLAQKLAVSQKSSPEKRSTQAASKPLPELGQYAPITVNGLFGKATQGQLTPIVAASAAAPVAPATAPTELLLLGTVVGSHRESFALVRHTTKNEERVIRLGEMVFDAGRLAEVGRERAFIVINGKKVELLTPMTPPAAAPPTRTEAPQQVASLGGGNFVLDQRALNNALDNPAQVMTAARLLPRQKGGKIEGFRASEVKPGGLFAMIGIKNGDVLVRLNEFPIDAPDKALQSLVALKGQNRLKLDVIRDGQPQTLNYDIR